MRILVVEDDFASQIIMEEILCRYGECTVVNNGREGVDAFKKAVNEREPYDLICLDIMMPELNGHEALVQIRENEERRGIYGSKGVKVIMVTSLSDISNIRKAFVEQCEAYVLKPVAKIKMCGVLENLGFVEQNLKQISLN